MSLNIIVASSRKELVNALQSNDRIHVEVHSKGELAIERIKLLTDGILFCGYEELEDGLHGSRVIKAARRICQDMSKLEIYLVLDSPSEYESKWAKIWGANGIISSKKEDFERKINSKLAGSKVENELFTSDQINPALKLENIVKSEFDINFDSTSPRKNNKEISAINTEELKNDILKSGAEIEIIQESVTETIYSTVQTEKIFSEIDELFKRFAGPAAAFACRNVRESIGLKLSSMSKREYALRLSSVLTNATSRAKFIDSANEIR